MVSLGWEHLVCYECECIDMYSCCVRIAWLCSLMNAAGTVSINKDVGSRECKGCMLDLSDQAEWVHRCGGFIEWLLICTCVRTMC